MTFHSSDITDSGWREALSPVLGLIDQLGAQLAGQDIVPPAPQVLRCFNQPFAEVKVVIMGQDPYPTPGHAIGLSFATAATVTPLPRSLKNIFSEYQTDLGLPQPQTGDLTPWTKQGVLLLNRVLTTLSGQAGAHLQLGWQEVTDCALAALAARNQPLVAVLWGKQAASVAPLLPGIPTVISAHPSPLSARRGFFGSHPFTQVNQLLAQQGAQPVAWQLP